MRLPEQKDVVVVDAEPHLGREYDGHSASTGNVRRHMVVMSSSSYTRATGMVSRGLLHCGNYRISTLFSETAKWSIILLIRRTKN